MTTWGTVSTLDRMFDDVMRTTRGAATNPRAFDPEIDVRTTDDEVVIVCDVPGVRHEDLELTVDNRVLTLAGSRKFEDDGRGHVVLGRSYGTFRRSFSLPPSLDTASLSANLLDGVLTIRIPRHPKPEPIKIAIGQRNDNGDK